MYRHQFLLVIFLIASVTQPVFGGGQRSEGRAGADLSASPADVTVAGRLTRNTAQPEKAPYVLLDGRGMVRSYVRSGADTNLESYVGRQVRLAGHATRTRDGGAPLLMAAMIAGSEQAAKGRDAPVARRVNSDQSVRRTSHYAVADEPQRGRRLTPEPAADRPEKPLSSNGKDRLTPRPTEEMGGVEPISESPMDGAACATCGECGEPCGDCNCYCRGPSGCVWIRAEYLFWWTQGMNTPPLVTSGPTPQQPGYFGAPGTQVLFGNGLVNDGGRSGGRLIAGMWLDSCKTIGIEGEYLGLGNEVTHFRQWSSGDPIISRPFFDVTRPITDPQNIEKVAFPRGNTGSLDGSISVDTITKFQSAGARLRFYLDSEDCCWSNPCCPEQTVRSGWQTDFLLGYRYLRLDDRLGIREELTSTDTEAQGAFLVQDHFDTENQFNGGELGLSIVMRRGRWSLEVIPKIALGTTHESVSIYGSTRTTQANGTNSTVEGGLLALSSNIGQYEQDRFAVVPELGLNLGYQVSCHLQLNFGYTFLYWSTVARSGEQIDYKVNPDLIPGGGATANPNLLHPAFAFHETSFWAQGLNFGATCSW